MPLNRYYYKDSIAPFRAEDAASILGKIVTENQFDLNAEQRDAWISQTEILKKALQDQEGTIYFEFSIPRMGKRVDAVVLIGAVIFVVEFKVGEKSFHAQDMDQVMDYSLDLANFHEGSHHECVVPILVATDAPDSKVHLELTLAKEKLFEPLKSNGPALARAFRQAISEVHGKKLDPGSWERSGYKPTPTIVEATLALYRGHSVTEISRNDAGDNLIKTSATVSEVIQKTRQAAAKAICFVTGVPGAGKTLVGLDIANKHTSANDELYSVFLSGNGPLVAVLQEALARDKVRQAKEKGQKIRKQEAQSEVKSFVQNVHHFRDEGLIDEDKPPVEHVAIFDEAQRAWDLPQTRKFMEQRKKRPDFQWSEPEFLISCMDRHKDWGVVICLVGGGQEINTGEAGIGEWIRALNRSFPDWNVYVSDQLSDEEFGSDTTREALSGRPKVQYLPALHLKTSMRSFRSEKLSLFVKELLDLTERDAKRTFGEISKAYPLVLTRDLLVAKAWLKQKAKGSERYGIMASSKASRLRPHALDVKAKASPVHWFLNGKEDVRSAYFMEDVGTEFDVQGLELDWACVAWDADFRHAGSSWETYEFTAVPNKPLMRWTNVRKEVRRTYLKNAYRVLLTRARQGMVVFVPEGNGEDPSRKPQYYDGTFRYLQSLGLEVI